MLWAMCTDLREEQQAPAVVLQLRGAARDMASELSPQQLSQGAVLDFGQGPVQCNGLTLLMHLLNARFAPLAEETNLRAVTDLLGFQRVPNERTDELLTRFETIRHRARQTAGFDMGIPGISFMLLRTVGVTVEQQNQLLSQFQIKST